MYIGIGRVYIRKHLAMQCGNMLPDHQSRNQPGGFKYRMRNGGAHGDAQARGDNDIESTLTSIIQLIANA